MSRICIGHPRKSNTGCVWRTAPSRSAAPPSIEPSRRDCTTQSRSMSEKMGDFPDFCGGKGRSGGKMAMKTNRGNTKSSTPSPNARQRRSNGWNPGTSKADTVAGKDGSGCTPYSGGSVLALPSATAPLRRGSCCSDCHGGTAGRSPAGKTQDRHPGSGARICQVSGCGAGPYGDHLLFRRPPRTLAAGHQTKTRTALLREMFPKYSDFSASLTPS